MTSHVNAVTGAPDHPAASAVTTPGRRFCVIWLGAVLALSALVGAVDALIDPYLVVGAPRIAGLNAIKPETETHTQLAKDYLIARARPAGLLLGNSKVDIGLDPDSPNWPDDARPAFNYGVPGIGAGDVLANLRRAIAPGGVRRALVLIELDEFMMPANIPPAGPAKPTSTWLEGVGQKANDLLLATLSLDALRASAMTVLAQGSRDSVDMSPGGATSEGGFRADIAADGYSTLFLQKDAFIAQRLARLVTALRARPDAGPDRLDAVAGIIALCRQNGIALDLAIAPFHADYLEALDHAGLWPRYEQTKTVLARLVASEGGDMVRLWDFIGYDAYSTEPVPDPSDHAGRTRWFWEPSHFKRVLGEKILATIYQGAVEYGIRLTVDTVGPRLEADRQAKAVYQAHNNGSRERLARTTHSEPQSR